MPRKKVAPPSKLCMKRGHVVPLTGFYKHKDWHAQQGHDIWCKKCIQEYCTTKEKLKEYCWYNNRAWSEYLWEKAEGKAQYSLGNNPEYLDSKTSVARKKVIEEEATCRQYLCMMNFGGMYMYSDNADTKNGIREYNPTSFDGTISKEAAAV